MPCEAEEIWNRYWPHPWSQRMDPLEVLQPGQRRSLCWCSAWSREGRISPSLGDCFIFLVSTFGRWLDWLFLEDDWIGSGIEMISSIILRWGALCQTAAYWMSRNRLSSSSLGSGCKTTICSGYWSVLEWFCYHVSVSQEAPRNWVIIIVMWFCLSAGVLSMMKLLSTGTCCGTRVFTRTYHGASLRMAFWIFLDFCGFFLPPKIDWPLNKNPWNHRWMAEVLRHEMLPRVILYILSQPCDLVLLNCSAGFHRAPCIAALLFAILVASHLNFISGVCFVLWVGVNLGK